MNNLNFVLSGKVHRKSFLDNFITYIVGFKKENRQKMHDRFFKINETCVIYNGVQDDDNRLLEIKLALPNVTKSELRIVAVMLSHLDLLRHFYEQTDLEYGIFCEDDIHINKNYRTVIKEIIYDIEVKSKQSFDCILLGYLSSYPIHEGISSFPFAFPPSYHKSEEKEYYYHRYPEGLFGAQMYMLSRKHVKNLLETYTIDYCIKSLQPDSGLQPFNPDFTLTKSGNRVLVRPMVAIEEFRNYEDPVHGNFHQKSFNYHFDSNVYI
jgi:hypothetical protein